MEDSVIEKNYIKSQVVSKDIINIFQSAKMYTEQMSINRDIIKYLKEVKDREDIWGNKSYDYVYDYLVKIKESNPVHFLAWVANENANFYLDSENVVPEGDYDVKKRPWYSVAVNSRNVEFTYPYIEWETKKTVISSIKAIREDNNIIGFVVVDIMLDSIPEIFKNIGYVENEKKFLIDNDGIYIYHEDPEKIMNGSVNEKDDPLNKYVSEIYKKDGGFYNVIYMGKEYYMSSYEIGESGWKIISLTDTGVAKSEIYDVYSIIIGFMIISFILIIVLINFIIKIYADPYKILSSYASAISRGDFSKNIPKKYLDRTDEMGKICNAFQIMIEAFRNENILLEDKIKLKNEELKIQYDYIFKTEKMASLGNIVAGVAHEINTPLGIGVSIASHIESINAESLEKIRNGTMTKEDLIKFMKDVSESVDLLGSNLRRGANLVKNFKKVAVNQNNEEKEMFNLKENIESIIVSLRGEYKKKNHRIGLYCDGNLNIWSYPGLFSQIFTNLIMNSIFHGFQNTREGFIKIDCRIDNDKLMISYEDNGQGISPENMEKIYEPFFTTKRSEGSSGLGMNIIFNIITQNLDGKIEGYSQLGKYTKFEIEIPLNHYNYS